MIDLIIDSYINNYGMPIGNLTSQLFANIYLNELDHFIKDKLGIRCYVRYMDDFIILDTDKKRLFKIRNLIKEFLEQKLKLKLHPKKSEYFPISKGIDFLGYVVFYDYILLRKSTVRRFKKRLKKI
jgi:retron-type reverse transcriptase